MARSSLAHPPRLLDGRNRREAARMAGVVPPVVVTDIDPKLAVHRSNNQNRDATPGQKAMAFAMQFPEATEKGGRGKKKTSAFNAEVSVGFGERYESMARYVLRNNPITEGQRYPQRCLAIMAGSLSLTEAYELTQADEKKRDEEEKIRQENAELLKYVRGSYPDLATRISARWQDSVEAIIDTGRLLADAKRALGHGNWLAMFHNKEVPFGISTADKLMKTATDERISNSDHGPNLPQSWRTLYELTKYQYILNVSTENRLLVTKLRTVII